MADATLSRGRLEQVAANVWESFTTRAEDVLQYGLDLVGNVLDQAEQVIVGQDGIVQYVGDRFESEKHPGDEEPWEIPILGANGSMLLGGVVFGAVAWYLISKGFK